MYREDVGIIPPTCVRVCRIPGQAHYTRSRQVTPRSKRHHLCDMHNENSIRNRNPGEKSSSVLLGLSESHNTRTEHYKLEMPHGVLYYKTHGHGNKKNVQWAAMPPFFRLTFDPETFFEASLSSRSSRSSIFLFLFLFGGCFIDTCGTGPSFAFEGISTLKTQYSVSVVLCSKFVRAFSSDVASFSAFEASASLLNLTISSSDIREGLMTPVCRAVSASSSCLRR
jgi:hypothetical protein